MTKPTLIRRTLAVTAACALMAGTAQSQSLSATPIAFDLSAEDSATVPLLIAAYQPQLEIAPQLSFSSTNETRVALTTDANRPQPSIILGRIEVGQEEAFGIEGLLPATVAEVGFAHTDLEARVALRETDPIMLRKLVEGGHVDPPETELKAALQTELARMNCYRSRIDNAWGPGSRRSVASYLDVSESLEWPDQEPSTELFRAIILREDVRCETPVAAVARPTPSASSSSNSRPRPVTAAPKPRAPKPAAAPKPSNTPKIQAGSGIGVFR